MSIKRSLHSLRRLVETSSAEQERLRRLADLGDSSASSELTKLSSREREYDLKLPKFTAKVRRNTQLTRGYAKNSSPFFKEVIKYLDELKAAVAKHGVPAKVWKMVSDNVINGTGFEFDLIGTGRNADRYEKTYYELAPPHTKHVATTQEAVAKLLNDVIPKEIRFLISQYGPHASVSLQKLLERTMKLTPMQCLLVFGFAERFPSRMANSMQYKQGELMTVIENEGRPASVEWIDGWNKAIDAASKVNV